MKCLWAVNLPMRWMDKFGNIRYIFPLDVIIFRSAFPDIYISYDFNHLIETDSPHESTYGDNEYSARVIL